MNTPRQSVHEAPGSADVVVVGGGGAGLAAALSAAERGVHTLVLEKRLELGGTTRFSVGSICAANTRLQRRAGIADNADDFRADMDGFIPEYVARDNPRLRFVLAAEAGITVDWLEDLGVVFAGPFPEPPNRVPRMHNIIPGSRMVVAKLARAAQRAGVKMLLDAAAEDLLLDRAGRVIGVRYARQGQTCEIKARRAVILASGDFAGNRAMREAFLAPAPAASIAVNPHNTGDGHELARRVGAGWRNMDVVLGPQYRFPRASAGGFIDKLPEWPWLARLGAYYFEHAPSWLLRPVVTSLLIAHMSPSEKLFEAGAVLVDLDGQRLGVEKSGVSLALAREASGYIVLDESVAQRFKRYPNYISTAPGIAYAYFPDYERGRPDLVHRACSVQALAQRLGMAVERLRAATAGLGSGMLYALGPVRAMLTITEGSVMVDASCRVLRDDATPVEGLYAAGGTGQGGMTLRGHGLHLAWALTSGRIAGEAAARATPADVSAAAAARGENRAAAIAAALAPAPAHAG
ncbi:MAG: FAD-dependent oxidoreductase [Burkholderiales bacterium]|nr:FAD-dependent oxidoreductase [Burkholderiales bacterium]